MVNVFYLLFVCLVLLPQSSEARSLHWQDIEVRARLDAEGRLHVREQQGIVFSGAWNGGERTFRILPGQKMKFASISRIDADGRDKQLLRGNLALVDHWDHNGHKSIRWRSRLPSDPDFNNSLLTYVLHYSYSHILIPTADAYLLDHDFCFPDRVGVVKNFRLELEFDPVWNRSPISMVRTNIAPGKGVVVQQQLIFSGENDPTIYKEQAPLPKAAPAVPPSPAPGWLGLSLLLILSGWVIWKSIIFYRWEQSLNRFVPLPATSSVNEKWLAEELFIHKPEVVGATWDRTTSTAEVAAVLARLVQEGKMKSWLEPCLVPFFNIKIPGLPPILHLQLLQSRELFKGYEYELIKGLFVDDSSITDTKTVREYYRKKRKTFDPVLKIQEPLSKQMRKLVNDGQGALDMIWVPTVILAVTGFFLLLTNAFLHQTEFVPLLVSGVSGVVFFWIMGFATAFSYRDTVLFLGWRLFGICIPVTCIVIGFGLFLFFPVSSLLIVGLFCMAMGITNNIINQSKSREGIEGLALRQKFGAARNFFKEELSQAEPQIIDSWFPYLLAFDLGPDVDIWFRKFGRSVGYVGSTGNVSSGTGFTGGGGTFGGGGASGSWSAAVGSLTASGGGASSGGGGGGGSSGGGGGGGW